MLEKETGVEKPSMPRIGDLAPDFEAETTHGRKTLSVDYKGKWVVLFSHPADFTPVCTTEFVAFSEIYPEHLQPYCVGPQNQGETGRRDPLPRHRGSHHGGRESIRHDPSQ